MSRTSSFAARPSDPERWVGSSAPKLAAEYSARLTIDITPELRGRIKVVAFRRGITVAKMLRLMLEREFANADAVQP